jgi:hypothetical protein
MPNPRATMRLIFIGFAIIFSAVAGAMALLIVLMLLGLYVPGVN